MWPRRPLKHRNPEHRDYDFARSPRAPLFFVFNPSLLVFPPLTDYGVPFPLSLFCNPVKLKLIRLLLIPAQLNNSIYWLRFTYRISAEEGKKSLREHFHMEGKYSRRGFSHKFGL